MDSTLEVQKGIVAKLKGASGVTDLVSTRVYDAVPHNAAYPMVVMGVFQGFPWEQHLANGFEVIAQIEAISEKRGAVQTRQIQSAVYAALHDQALTLDTQNHILTRLIFQSSDLDNDGITTRGIQRFRVVTHP